MEFGVPYYTREPDSNYFSPDSTQPFRAESADEAAGLAQLRRKGLGSLGGQRVLSTYITYMVECRVSILGFTIVDSST